VSIDEAARALGLTVDAVRKRVQRGQIAHEKDAAGRVRIILDESGALQVKGRDLAGRATSELVEELRDRVSFLELQLQNRTKEIRRRDGIILSLTESVRAQTPSTREASRAGSRESRGTPSHETSQKASDDNEDTKHDDARYAEAEEALRYWAQRQGFIDGQLHEELRIAGMDEEDIRRRAITIELSQITSQGLAYSATGKYLFEEDPDEYARAMQRKTFLFVMFMFVMIVGTGLAFPLASAALQSHNASPWQYLALVLWALWALPPIFGYLLGRHYILPLLTHVYIERKMDGHEPIAPVGL